MIVHIHNSEDDDTCINYVIHHVGDKFFVMWLVSINTYFIPWHPSMRCLLENGLQLDEQRCVIVRFGKVEHACDTI